MKQNLIVKIVVFRKLKINIEKLKEREFKKRIEQNLKAPYILTLGLLP